MTESEVIIVDGLPDILYDEFVRKAMEYAVISIPFTFNRMGLQDIKKRILNISKGKVAEMLFQAFCLQNNIPVDFDSCTTPFWKRDTKDFVSEDTEWDIKNNFYYGQSDVSKDINFIDFPAFIPNNFEGDQWSGRSKLMLAKTTKSAYVFTFLRWSDKPGGKSFFEIDLSEGQVDMISRIADKYQGKKIEAAPFDENLFWSKMNSLSDTVFFKINFRPPLIITGVASDENYYLFKNTGKDHTLAHYKTYIHPEWYSKKEHSLSFLKGTLFTTIINATSPVGLLPSFFKTFDLTTRELEVSQRKL
ncbi:MAG: hypothetical protein IPM42_00660 [Saprospiraceae bacterium]|nr:hypothetical protein [Saprospiraceae bacterium]